MNRFIKSLKGALTLNFILVATIPILVIGFFTLHFLNHKLTDQIVNKNQVIVESLATETEEFLAHAEQVMQQAGDGVDDIGIQDEVLLEKRLVSLIKNFSYFESVRIVDDQGMVLKIAPYNADYIGNSIAGNDFYQKARKTKQPVWSTVFISSVTGQPTIILARPLEHGMIIGNLNLSSLNQVVSRGATMAGGWAGITDKEGTYIGHTSPQEVSERRNVSQFDFVQKALQGIGGNYQTPFNGKDSLVSVAVIWPLGWPVIVAQDAEVALASVKDTRHIFMAGAMSGLLLAVIVALWLLAKILQPIVKLAKRMQAVAAGKYQGGKSPDSYKEFAALASEFDMMADTVALRERALQHKTQELEVSMQQLENSNCELEQFAYVTSHDLKAPLRAIVNLSQWLEEDLADGIDASAREKLALMRNRAHRMENLIAGILEYSRIGRINNESELVDTGQLLEEMIEVIEKPVGIAIEIGSPMPSVQADRIRLWQVFANLIDNAVKHHERPDGLISITVSEQGTFYEFSVADDGPGIDPAYHKKIFEIFQTLKPRDQFESTGVGLALVKKIIEQQGGTIRLESERGQGATFIFTWPRQQ